MVERALMKQIRKRWRRLVPLSAVAGCLTAALAGCMDTPYARGTPGQLLPDDPRARELSYSVDGRRVHYVQQDGGPARILFIHGSPGDWQGWAPYLRDRRLRERASMIAVDRPGWGQSVGAVVPDLERQAAMLQPLLDGTGRTLLVAHSYGGAVAARMAMDDPAQVEGLVLIAPTLSPRQEGPRWYDHLATLFPIRLLLPDRLRLSYTELAPLPQALRKMQPHWAELRLPVAVVQG
jgi:pimeloyl-ACP methyl ester carboxylesterase